jgi:hypothetical protein
MSKKSILGNLFGGSDTQSDGEAKDPQAPGADQGTNAAAGDSAPATNGEESPTPSPAEVTPSASPEVETTDSTPSPAETGADAQGDLIASAPAPVEVPTPNEDTNPHLVKNVTSFNITIIGEERNRQVFAAGCHVARHVLPLWVLQHPEFKNAVRERHLVISRLK